MRGKALDLTGMKFGRLTAIKSAGIINKRTYWLVTCDCGITKTVSATELTRGRTVSCGCRKLETRNRTTHGYNGTPTYAVWSMMIQRCTNPKNVDYPNYGGRGITVCPEWRKFAAFLADMGEKPAGLTIDRTDNDGNYEPGNCRWATRLQQSHNRRCSIDREE